MRVSRGAWEDAYYSRIKQSKARIQHANANPILALVLHHTCIPQPNKMEKLHSRRSYIHPGGDPFRPRHPMSSYSLYSTLLIASYESPIIPSLPPSTSPLTPPFVSLRCPPHHPPSILHATRSVMLQPTSPAVHSHAHCPTPKPIIKSGGASQHIGNDAAVREFQAAVSIHATSRVLWVNFCA